MQSSVLEYDLCAWFISVLKMILWCKLLLIVFANVFIQAEVLIDNDGGYKNVIVGITPHLPESRVESLLLQLEVIFRKASIKLQTASQGNVFFKEITFAIPRKFEKWISSQNVSSGASYFRKPDIYLTENDVFTDPYTLQHEGCGKPGLRIHIPSDFLVVPREKGASSLVKQWAHYRYGVFDESGFSNDEIYPACYRIPGSETIEISDCTNKEATYEFRKGSQNDYERFPSVCAPVPVEGKNNDIVSSLMTNIEFPKMSYFCDDESHPHNRNAPTKQNALCRQKSIWEIISTHDDFKTKRKNPSSLKTTFKYISQSNPRFIIAIDSSSKMALNGRMDLVRNAFSYFILYNLPNNSAVGLLDMILDMENIEKTLSITDIQTKADIERLINDFPDTNEYGDICVHCTIEKILEVWKLDINDIIIITATDIMESWVDSITTMLKSRSVALHTMYFERKLKQPALLEKVAKNSGGKFFYIAEAFPPGTSTSTLTLLYEAFRSVYESFSWMNRNHVLVDQKTFSNNCSPKCVLSFPSDRSMQSFQVLITGPNFYDGEAVPKNSILLDNGEQRYVRRNATFIFQPIIRAYMFTIENPQPRQWNLTFERKSGHNKPIVVIVRAMVRNYDDIISMQSWTSISDDKNVGTPERPPITMYSEIKKGNNPVADVDVVAYSHQTSTNKEVFLKLKDSGEGDPDITKNDGIFSRYLTDVEPGYYSLTVVAEKKSSELYQNSTDAINKERNCCGSVIPTYLTYNSGSFKRITTHQSFFVESQHAGVTYPPRRIADLRVDRMEILKHKGNNIKCYVLKWTAPGENYDTGKAISYSIKVFSTPDDAVGDFDNGYVLDIGMLNIQGPILEPWEAGTVQTAYVELTNLTSGTYFIAMKTTSHSRKISDVSNIVEILHTEPTPLPLSTDSVSPNIVPNTPGNDGSGELGVDGVTAAAVSTKLAIGLTCGILLILIIIGLILFVYFERNKKLKTTNNTGIGHNAKKTESNDALCNGNGGGNISIISPVNSWGADSLISHYETIQKKRDTETNGVTNQYNIPNDELENKETDSISIVSTKYSYDNKIDQNSLYDPIYYHQVRSQDEINYPYNPGYTPFSPMYTSSLRRFDNTDILGNPYPSDNASVYSYTTGRNNFSRLKTDV